MTPVNCMRRALQGRLALVCSLGTVDWIALLALAFTLFSFWWVQLRPGRLQITAPITFSSVFKSNSDLALFLPLVLRNPGAVPLVVRDLEVRLIDAPSPPFHWVAYRPDFHSEDRQWARSQAIPSRGEVVWVYEFQRLKAAPITVDLREDSRIQVRAQIENERRFLWIRRKPEWRTILDLELYQAVWSRQLIVRRNGPLA